VATQNTIHLPDDLLAELQAKAAAEGKSVDELAAETLRKGLEDRSWQALLEYGRERGEASGYTEDDVPRLVKEWRQAQRTCGSA
jgi:plasmid stability protein